jgi:dipeptidyl aminopeptidase/acylaminoacyl peptidase
MSIRVFAFLLFLLMIMTACQQAAPPPVSQSVPEADAKRQLTAADYQRAERFLSANRDTYVRNATVTPTWIGEEDRFWYKRKNEAGEKEFITVDAATGKKSPSFDHESVSAALKIAIDAKKAADAEKAAEEAKEQGEASENETSTAAAEPAGDEESEALPFESFTYNEEGGIDVTVGADSFSCSESVCEFKEAEEPAFGPGFTASPDGQWAVYFKDHNLWLKSADGETDIALTTDGEEGLGYGIEVGTSTSYISKLRMGMPPAPMVKWAPDSGTFLTTRIDQREVGKLSLIEYAPQDGSNRPVTHTWRYALATDEIKPTGTFVVFEAGTGRRTDIDHPAMEFVYDNITGADSKDVWWHEDSKGFGFVHRKPYARGYSLHSVDLGNGNVTTLFNRTSERTSHPGMSMVLPPQGKELNDGRFIYYSDEDNWGHLYLRATDGAINQITSGEWNVVAVLQVDEENDRIHYIRSRPESESNPYYYFVYSINFDGTDERVLTPAEATHGAGLFAILLGGGSYFSPSGKFFVDNYATIENPGTSELRDVDGNLISVLETADISALDEDGLVPPQAFTATAADGITKIYGVMHFPSDFDPGKTYPIIDSIYPGPQVSRVAHDMISSMFSFGSPQALAELGFIVITVDGRGTPGRSRDYLYPPGVNVLASAGFLEDHVAAMEQLADRHGFIDIDRVGIFGWSGGGYASTHAMFMYPDFFKVAVSGAGNHDQRTYIPIWGESYVGPDNGENFEAASNPHMAEKLKGKLYLVHGMLDDNVHPANTMQVVQALIDANKDFDMLPLPNSNHGPGEATAYFARRQWDYFVTHLQGAIPPQGYEIKLPKQGR